MDPYQPRDGRRCRRNEEEGSHRREKIAYLTTKRLKMGTGERELQLYVRAGAPGIGTLDDRGRLRFEELRRIKTQRAVTQQGRFRWYNKYAIPGS
jgi:hypothetical protein